MSTYIEGNCEGKCVDCGSDVNYGSVIHDMDYIYYPTVCSCCKSVGKEYYSLVYNTSITIED